MNTRSNLYLTLLCLLLFVSNIAFGNNGKGKPLTRKERKSYHVRKSSRHEIKDRFESLPQLVKFKNSKGVRKFVSSYTHSGRNVSRKIIGNSLIYFPIFDYYLEKYGLPEQLKYLSIIESGLNPTISSPVGARGLWQLMPATARKYGLVIDDYVDERCDPHKSTDAAFQHLAHLYDDFGNWELAMAAYNCGGGRVRKAIRKGKSRNFWKIKKYLPKETQDYLVRFLAAQYMMNYYHLYDIHPNYKDYNYTMTESILIYKYTTFESLSEKTGIPKAMIAKLNPSYAKNVVLQNKKGSYIILPIIGRSESKNRFMAIK